VFILNAIGDGSYGFQPDDNLPARQAMFSLLSEADGHNFTVIANYLIEPGRINATAIRVALIRDATSVTPTIPATTRLKEFPPRGAQQHVQEAASVARAQGRLRSADGAASVFNCRCCDIRQ